jgi:acetyl esterase
MEAGPTGQQASGAGVLDPQAAAFLQVLALVNAPPNCEQTPEQAREMVRSLVVLAPPPEPIARVEDSIIPGPAGQIPVRVYTPEGEGPFPILVYNHGGGWVIGGLDTHEGTCRSIANSAGCVIVSVDYRLAPECKFPAAVEDSYAALEWVTANARSINGDPARIAVGGDSSGGNIAAVVAILARDRNGPRLCHQLLIYPVTDVSCLDTDSYRQFAEGYMLTKADMAWFRDHYVRSPEDARSPLVSPLLADDLSRLPPALVITGEFDVLRDEGEAYAKRLNEAGVPARCSRYNGMIHGFFSMEAIMDRAIDAINEAAAALREAFGTSR